MITLCVCVCVTTRDSFIYVSTFDVKNDKFPHVKLYFETNKSPSNSFVYCRDAN